MALKKILGLRCLVKRAPDSQQTPEAFQRSKVPTVFQLSRVGTYIDVFLIANILYVLPRINKSREKNKQHKGVAAQIALEIACFSFVKMCLNKPLVHCTQTRKRTTN